MRDDPNAIGTLEWCNEQRAKRGMDPMEDLPKGKRRDPGSCPCGKATGLRVGAYDAYDPEEPDKGIEIPTSVSRFVERFDKGEYPEYDADFHL